MKSQKGLLSIHHVGGRGGSRAFPIHPIFERDVINVLYDADSDCLKQMEDESARLSSSRLIVLPECLGGESRPATLHINYDPYTSSLLPASEDYAPFTASCHDHDYVLGESFRTMERRTVAMRTLDDICRIDEAPPPDFLSIDTQGSEYEILCGGRAAIEASTLAIVAEVEFHRLYCDQKLFGDVCELLAECNFHFVRFAPHPSWSPSRKAVGLRGSGFQLSADALFLRRLDAPGMTPLQLRKLAFFAILECQIEYALDAIQKSGPAEERLASCTWYQFVQELADASAELSGGAMPPTFAEKHTFASSCARFDSAKPVADVKPDPRRGMLRSLKTSLRRLPGLHGVEKLVREAGRSVRRSLRRESLTAVESLLLRYGLTSQAETIRDRRLSDSRICRQAA